MFRSAMPTWQDRRSGECPGTAAHARDGTPVSPFPADRSWTLHLEALASSRDYNPERWLVDPTASPAGRRLRRSGRWRLEALGAAIPEHGDGAGTTRTSAVTDSVPTCGRGG
jgi:hypothetical protein